MTKTARPAKRKRPIAVTIAGLIIFVYLLYLVGRSAYESYLSGVWQPNALASLFTTSQVTVPQVATVGSWVRLALGILGLVILIGFLQQKRWSWVAFVTWLALGLVRTLALYFLGAPDYDVMLMGVVLMLLLNQQEVQEAFGVRQAYEPDSE